MTRKNYYNHRPNQNTPKYTKLFSIPLETIIITDPTRIDLKNKLSYSQYPELYHNHKPTSGYDQETITIIDPARIDLKNKLSYFSLAQETITIIDPPVDMTRKLS